ncbi:hypothetical protein ACGFOU_13290 [Streptomyces sp. NPDC048595]|uniref:hypothetical protein n=1 Tax=Streptomyces sp. NPDC048595 TaxID=3365576 RepID=UPI003715EBE4
MIIELDVPPEIEAGLNSGDLTRYGSVIRDRLGGIVKHLKEVPESSIGQEVAKRTAVSFNRPLAIATVTALGVAAAGTSVIISARKRRQVSKSEAESQEQTPTSRNNSAADPRQHLETQKESPIGAPRSSEAVSE